MFLDILKQVQINIPLVDLLQKVPKYVKYIKDIVANKRRQTEFETVALIEECSSRIQRKLPQKLKDPDSFTIQILIGKHAVGRSLYDLGASINLMPLSVFRQLGLGVIEDVLVQVGSFICPTDFIILDYEPDQEVPFILGRPFLAMGRAIINVCERKMTMRVGDRVKVFNVYKALSLTNTQEDKLLRVLRKHTKAIGWTIADIKGISPLVCMHKIFLEDGHRPNVELQRRLNPIMKEVVKKEEGIMLGHKVSRSGIEVDKTKVEAVEKLPPLILVKGVRSFLGHAGFYRRFIKDFSKIANPLCWLLEKDVTFNFDDACLMEFEKLKKKLVSALIIMAPDWSLPFELMCDASDHGFDVEIRDQKGTKNQVDDHLSKLENHDHVEEGGQIKEVFPDEQLFAITQDPHPWYADYVNYLVSEVLPPEIESEARKRFLHDVNFYYWDKPYLYKQCADQLMRRCILENGVELVLYDCHASPYGSHHGGDRTAAKVL
ncbi:uncharacterized protein LOC142162274 [Nicotiana tabacum]|uniref:Uncharacterized protein LOC142162274 n=1 Tax=Nicotiana tabacum TaxID=4097 RepID=A0AC58RPS5_TOBAC